MFGVADPFAGLTRAGIWLIFRDCSKDTGLSHHAALALCRILVV